MRNRRRIELKYIIIIIAVVTIALIAILSYTIKNKDDLNSFEQIIKDVTITIEKTTTKPFTSIGEKIKDYKKLKTVLKENKKLKSNIDKLLSIEAENKELKKELKELKKELNIDKVLSEYTYLNATVISRNTNLWYNTLTIDKGSNNGIKKGMVVINSTGLIGKIVNVSSYSSDVKLITAPDTKNKISVTINNGESYLTGLINNYDYKTGYLEIEGISNTDKVSIGDLVYTSGLGGVYPSGILIGTVTEITTDIYDLSKIINVTPSAEFKNINYVTVLKRNDANDNN